MGKESTRAARAKETVAGQQLRAAADVLRAVRQVRRRWRAKLQLQGWAIAVAGGLAVFVGAATGLEVLRFQPAAVTALRIVLWLAIVALAARFVLWPLLRRVSDERVALYLEEHEPSLQSRLLAAVEASPTRKTARSELHEAVVARAAAECRRIRFGARIERPAIRRSAGALAVAATTGLLLFLFGPGFLRHGAPALLFPARAAEAVNPYSVTVQPGDTTISRNSDLLVSAVLHGFDAGDATLFTQSEGESGFSAMPMIDEGESGFDGLLLNVAVPTRYYVEAGGVRSETFSLGVADLPAVDRLEMEYHFPSYTGLAPRHFEFGGDVAALAGTTVRLVATSTLPSPGAALATDWGDTIPMTPGPGDTFEGSFVVRRSGFYEIRLQTADGAWIAGAPSYHVDMLTDQGPSISFNKPGRDIEASSIEEVFVEARAVDDVGVAEVLWVYSVNGAPPDTVRIHAAAGRPLPQATASHTVFMEDFELEVGDLIAYHGIARDNAPVVNEALTDIYFFQIRPFRRDFREAQGGGAAMGAGGAGEGAMNEDLSGLQRQIVAASFNLVRDRASYDDATWEENVVSVALGQQRLREQVETLRQRMVNRGIAGADEAFRKIAETLPRAVEAMREAEDSLRALRPGGAIGPEQRALRELQKAEETYERFVSLDARQGGGGGQGGGPSAEDLADLFELETDQLRNQYEMVQRSRRQTADDAVDQSLEKLRELARRQEQELERQRRRAVAQQGGSQGGGGGGQVAQDLAEQAEEAARRLERLSRETGDPSLDDVSRQLQRAADAMRRAAAGRGSEGVAQAQSALRRLRDARERLESVRGERLERDLEDVRNRTAQMADRQRDIASRMEAMRRAGRPSGDQIERIRNAKEAMADEAGRILSRLEQTAAAARREGRTGAAELEEAAETIRDTQLRERLLYSRGLVGRPDQEEYAEAFENQTAQAIQSLRKRLDEAAAAVRAQAGGDPADEALEAAGDLVRSLESMGRGQGGGAPPEGGDRPGGGASLGQGRTRTAGPRAFTPGEVRQMRREARERTGELQGLADLVERAGADAHELAAMIAAMRALALDRTYEDPGAVLRLRAQLLDDMKQLEFRLRREFVADEERLLLESSGDVPDEYRALVEEYYRALSRTGSRSRGR